jgi:hypothetical protein
MSLPAAATSLALTLPALPCPHTACAALQDWVKDKLAGWSGTGRPQALVILGQYVADAGNDPEYDHIVPAVGTTLSGRFMLGDLTHFNLYSLEPMVRPWSQQNATRQGCKRELEEGGCLPNRVGYATAVTGIADANHATLPVRLFVARVDEPNYSPVNRSDPDEYRTAPEKPVVMRATVAVYRLTPGRKYRLMRFSSPAKVPTKGFAAAWLASSYDSYVDFVAPNSTTTNWGLVRWVHTDRRPFLSNATMFYRCVVVSIQWT